MIVLRNRKRNGGVRQMLKIEDKEIRGYQFADGVHWYWGDEEVAVINQYTSEIEWCKRKLYFPKAVIEAIYSKKPNPSAKWIIEAKRISNSVTQGVIDIQINGKSVLTFNDDKELRSDGKYHSQYSDDELGQFVIAALWHKYDDVYHYSDRAKKIFDPNWKKNG